MIFDNLGLSDLSPELGLFLWQIVGRALPKNFAFSTNENDLNTRYNFALLNISRLCSLRFKLCHECNFLVFVSLRASCAGSMASSTIPSLSW